MTGDARELLKNLFDEIVEEAAKNRKFGARLEEIIEQLRPSSQFPLSNMPEKQRRVSRRRAPGVIDPLSIMQVSEEALREALTALDIEQLKDIVAEHGMDTNKLAMKWRARERLEDLIVTSIRGRLAKGDAFRRGGSSTHGHIGLVKTEE
jgi:hypothetical protein